MTAALGSETVEADLRASQKRVNELNGRLIAKNDQVMNLTRENKGLRHSLDKIHGKCRFLKEAVLIREKQLALKKKIVKEWINTVDGQRFVAKLGADSFSQGLRVKELMLHRANEKAENKLDLETLFKAGEEEFMDSVQEAAEEMKELEAQGPDEEEEAEKAAWEEALPAELLKKYDVDFSHFDISIPSRPPTPQASHVQAVPLLPSVIPGSPALSGGGQAAPSSKDGPTSEDVLDPLFTYEELMEGEE